MRQQPALPRTQVERLHSVGSGLRTAAKDKQTPTHDRARSIVEGLRNTAERAEMPARGIERKHTARRATAGKTTGDDDPAADRQRKRTLHGRRQRIRRTRIEL